MQQDDLRAEWGRRLTRAREALGLSIGDLARRTGIHKSQLARFERGEAGLGDEARIKVAAAIGQQVASLFPYPTIPTTETDCRSAECATAEAGSPRLATLLKEIPQDGRPNVPAAMDEGGSTRGVARND